MQREAEGDLSAALEMYLMSEDANRGGGDTAGRDPSPLGGNNEQPITHQTNSNLKNRRHNPPNSELAGLRADLEHFACDAEGRLRGRLAFYQGALHTARAHVGLAGRVPG